MRARVLCIVSAVVLTLPLSGCILTRDPYVSTALVAKSGSWRIDRQVDRVSGTSISSAVANGRASNTNIAFPRDAIVQLSCFINKPVVSFRFEFKVGTDRNSFLGYRFDEKPGHETNARFLANALTVVIDDDTEVAQFARDLAASNVLFIRIRSFNAGRTTAEFKVDGGEAAIASAYATCPVKQPEPQRVATQTSRKRSR